MQVIKRSVLTGLALSAAVASASGYEKSIMFGGKSAGLAGIATPYIEGSQALYFNPAGMAGTSSANDISVNLSPTFPEFKAPINNQNETVTSDRPTLYPGSLTYSRTLNDKWAVGVGYYISAGANASYKDIGFSGFSGTFTTRTDLIVSEWALGGAYKINDKWKVGLAWRVAEAKAEFDFLRRSGGAVIQAQVTELKDTQYDGYKLGVQYAPTEKTKLGLTYRSEVKFEADGTFNAVAKIPPYTDAPTSRVTTTAEVATYLPQAVTLGLEQVLNEAWNLYAEVGWTEYSKVERLELVTPLSTTVLEQNWKDQTNARIAAQYSGLMMPIRFGYGWTSRVTDPAHARPNFVPPGDAHTITLGTGYEIKDLAMIDAGLEYTWVNGDGEGAAAGTGGTGTDVRSGKYEVNEYALHLGARFTF